MKLPVGCLVVAIVMSGVNPAGGGKFFLKRGLFFYLLYVFIIRDIATSHWDRVENQMVPKFEYGEWRYTSPNQLCCLHELVNYGQFWHNLIFNTVSMWRPDITPDKTSIHYYCLYLTFSRTTHFTYRPRAAHYIRNIRTITYRSRIRAIRCYSNSWAIRYNRWFRSIKYYRQSRSTKYYRKFKSIKYRKSRSIKYYRKFRPSRYYRNFRSIKYYRKFRSIKYYRKFRSIKHYRKFRSIKYYRKLGAIYYDRR